MATANLKKFLDSLSKDELIKHILELDKKYKPVQEYYQLFLTNDIVAVVHKYKQVIDNEFFPKRGEPKMRLSIARNAVSEAKKLGLPSDNIADLMLFYVETGVEFTMAYGDIDEPFYNSMESMYLKALKFMHKENLLDRYTIRAKAIVDRTSDIGWGFHDTLCNYYYQYY
jgi:hypothetical protein